MKYRLLHNIGTENHPNYNTREEILACNDVLTFDGVYLNVLENLDVVRGKDVIFFIMGDYTYQDDGERKNNQFDLPNVPKLEEYCDFMEIGDMQYKLEIEEGKYCEIGWHTWSHPDLTTLTKEEIMREITPPFPMKSFAYPYGKYNDLVIECVKAAGYERAFSVFATDGTQWTIPRPYLNK